MARIAGVNIPREKRVEIGLTYVYGVGRTTANEILGKVVRYGGEPRPDDAPLLVPPREIEHTVARLSEILGRPVPPDCCPAVTGCPLAAQRLHPRSRASTSPAPTTPAASR